MSLGSVNFFSCVSHCENRSLERIQAYIKVEQEPEPKKARLPPAYWPASGEVRVENMSARYSLVSHPATMQ